MTHHVKTLLGLRNQESLNNLVPKIPRYTKEDYLYKTWDNIKQRLTNTNHKDYPRYGGRGMGMYAPWFKDYPAFQKYIQTELGERPNGSSLDRVDNDLGYQPFNLRWATPKQQANNREQGNRYVNTKNTPSQSSTDNIADYLVEKFKSPEFRPLFLKAAWRVDRGTIDRHVATSFELGKNPRAYFISLIKREKSYYA